MIQRSSPDAPHSKRTKEEPDGRTHPLSASEAHGPDPPCFPLPGLIADGVKIARRGLTGAQVPAPLLDYEAAETAHDAALRYTAACF